MFEFIVSSVLCVLPPGKVLDLSAFDSLQIPVDNGGGSFVQIRHPDLDSYTSDYFYTNPYDSTQVVFWAPENGSVSQNGAGPRTELTEDNNRFTFSGTHTMKYTMQVKETPSGGKVCIGQVKGDSCDSCFFAEREGETISNSTALMGAGCLIVVELIYDANKNGLLTAHMRGHDASGCTNVQFNLGNFDLDEKMDISMTVNGYDVRVSSNKVTLPSYDYSFWKGAHYGMHFKVGLYDQNSGGSGGAKGKLSNLRISHT